MRSVLEEMPADLRMLPLGKERVLGIREEGIGVLFHLKPFNYFLLFKLYTCVPIKNLI